MTRSCLGGERNRIKGDPFPQFQLRMTKLKVFMSQDSGFGVCGKWFMVEVAQVCEDLRQPRAM